VRSTSILRPKPIRGFENKKVLYLPCDLPSGTLAQALKRKARARKDLGFCSLYKLDGLSVLFGALGAAAAVLGLEAVIASDAEDIIVLGFCGSLSRRFRIGDAVGISRAIADEGTSRHYFPRRKSFLPSPILAGELETPAAGLLPRGVIISTDAPYRETFSWLQKSRRRGADLVDMETSAVFALAAFRGTRAAALQIVSDEVFSGRQRSAFSSPLLKERVRDVFLPLLGDRPGESG
jgi:purine-nucleoside phosphorylase